MRDSTEDQEPRLNLLGATACHAANMRGVGGAKKLGVMTEGPFGEVVIVAYVLVVATQRFLEVSSLKLGKLPISTI